MTFLSIRYDEWRLHKMRFLMKIEMNENYSLGSLNNEYWKFQVILMIKSKFGLETCFQSYSSDGRLICTFWTINFQILLKWISPVGAAWMAQYFTFIFESLVDCLGTPSFRESTISSFIQFLNRVSTFGTILWHILNQRRRKFQLNHQNVILSFIHLKGNLLKG